MLIRAHKLPFQNILIPVLRKKSTLLSLKLSISLNRSQVFDSIIENTIKPKEYKYYAREFYDNFCQFSAKKILL